MARDRSTTDAVALHAVFFVACGIVLGAAGGARGPRILGLVLAYLVWVVLVGWLRGHRRWGEILWLTLPISICQVLPDWFLVDGLDTLRFALDGAPRVGPVPLYMAGMWTAALFPSVLAGETVRAARGEAAGALAAIGLGAAMILGSEVVLPLLPVWEARRVATWGPVAHYIVVPEVLLAVATWVAWRALAARPRWTRLLAAPAVTLLYTGAAALSWLLLERR